MSKQIVAKRISRARVGRDAWVYELSEPVFYEQRGEKLSTRYVVIQTFWIMSQKRSSVVIYPSDEQGDVVSFNELPGSHVGDTDHDRAVREAGWTLDPKSVHRAPPSTEEARESVGPHSYEPAYASEEAREEFETQEAAVEHALRRPGGEEMFVYYEERKFLLAAAGQQPAHATPVRALSKSRAHEAQDFPTQDAAVTHAYSQRGGEAMYVYYEAGKYHLAAPGQQPSNATRVSSFRRPGEYGFAESAPVVYEAGAREQPGKPWPSPETVDPLDDGSRGHEVRETAPVIHEAGEHIQTTIVGEDSKPGDCLPWVRVTRDPERYEACLAQARKIGSINDSRRVYDLLSPMLAKEDQELLLVVLLDVRRQLRGVAEVHRGQRSSVGVSVADVMRIVITTGSEAFVLCHQHPSGNSKPSPADVDLTKTIASAFKPYGRSITFIGHVVVGVGEFTEISPSGEVSKTQKVR